MVAKSFAVTETKCFSLHLSHLHSTSKRQSSASSILGSNPASKNVSCDISKSFYSRKHLNKNHLAGNAVYFRSGDRINHLGNRNDNSDVFVAYSSSKWWRNSDDEYSSDDNLGPYPWEPSKEDFTSIPNWMGQDMITFFSTDGLVRIPARSSSQLQSNGKTSLTLRFREEDFMDPRQLLCLGALFDISATNGLDSGRRFCVHGFCRSVDMLSAVVEDSVKMQGGQIVVHEKKVVEGNLEEKLHLKVSVPLLFGVPPAMDALNKAIRYGGGIVDKVYLQWNYY